MRFREGKPVKYRCIYCFWKKEEAEKLKLLLEKTHFAPHVEFQLLINKENMHEVGCICSKQQYHWCNGYAHGLLDANILEKSDL